ncbi:MULTISPECIES: FliM/FliN family flagellar motor switch protein [unclassified Pseudomonas]|uniref:FliM/FliN family flagellar motor switch protein n=1 Tax=unclassified Pseudomonas TaxID=196821 RepID=UPI00191407B6|nr:MULTISPECIES: FliM/FliN family flagellar motor switch protein [unclassified Pseudomonas]MBK5553789.1 FliM/FliN family flagellar motor switch protein [Pseudomonas sp. TH03]MEB0223830.1 FliM/FliN family flagellar motor switch protein [Pseudomonas sp. 5S1]MEB0292792.1 FliM/FliN family flagellar motor switch protein [Pseudomonas sp. 10S4]WPX16295.1 FliM/FliN family flagellar motor switch protein [Pseudomonas sp. 10S4]
MDNDALYEDAPPVMDGDIAEAELAETFEEEPTAESITEDPVPPSSALTGLSLDLTVRSGGVSLSLEALQRLAPGSVLDVAGVTLGEATLCHGERVVAHGELVDVDGRLGLQITRVVFDR